MAKIKSNSLSNRLLLSLALIAILCNIAIGPGPNPGEYGSKGGKPIHVSDLKIDTIVDDRVKYKNSTINISYILKNCETDEDNVINGFDISTKMADGFNVPQEDMSTIGQAKIYGDTNRFSCCCNGSNCSFTICKNSSLMMHCDKLNNEYPAFFNYSASFDNDYKKNTTQVPDIKDYNVRYSPSCLESKIINPKVPIQINILANKPRISQFNVNSDFRHNKSNKNTFNLLKDTELTFEYDSVDFDTGDIPKYTIIDKDGDKIQENITDKRFSYIISEPGEHLFTLEVFDMQGNRDRKTNDTVFFVENMTSV
jgi:hypothetical protein